MTRGSGERELGKWSPVSLMRESDAGIVRQESYRRFQSTSFIAGAYMAGLFVFGAIGFLIGMAMDDESRTWILSSIGMVAVYVVGISAIRRIVRG